MKYTHRQSGFALILSVVIGLFLSLLFSAAFLRNQVQSQEIAQRLMSQQAFNAAETGLQRAVFELRRNPQWRPSVGGSPDFVNIPLRINEADPATTVGFYSVEVGGAPDYLSIQAVWVKSSGQDLTQRITRTLLAGVIVENPASFFISSAGDLRIGSGSTFNSNILGRDVYFDVNQSLPPAQRDITMNGDIYYLNHVYGADNPAVHITDGHETVNFPSLTFAGVDISRYKTIAQNGGRYFPDGYTQDPNQEISIANLNALNGVVFVEGDIHISGTIRDSMLFVASGNIFIDNNLVPPSDSSDPPQLGLLAKKDVFIPEQAPSDMTVTAFVMADGGTGSQGGILKALGPKFSKNRLTFNGAMSLRGTNPGGGNQTEVRTAADLNVYSNRVFEYNTQLRDSRKIPLLPYIANIVYWKEINPSETIPSPSDDIPS